MRCTLIIDRPNDYMDKYMSYIFILLLSQLLHTITMKTHSSCMWTLMHHICQTCGCIKARSRDTVETKLGRMVQMLCQRNQWTVSPTKLRNFERFDIKLNSTFVLLSFALHIVLSSKQNAQKNNFWVQVGIVIWNQSTALGVVAAFNWCDEIAWYKRKWQRKRICVIYVNRSKI